MPQRMSRRRSWRATIAAVATGAIIAVGAPAVRADDAPRDGESDTAPPEDARKEASRRFRQGVVLYRDGDYVAALVAFKRAYALAPNYRVLYNLGQTSRELKDYASALIAYRQYLEEGGDEIGGKRRREVEEALGDLVERVGTLTITTNVEGAEIQVDDEVVGTAPLPDPVIVNIGRRRIAASHPGHAPARRLVEVAGRDDLDVALSLVALEPGEGPPDPSGGKDDDDGLPVGTIVAGSVTAACGIAAGVLGGLALGARNARDDALATVPGDAARIQSEVDRTSNLALGTDIMLGATAAGAVTTLVFLLVETGGGGDGETPADEGTTDGDDDDEVSRAFFAPARLTVDAAVGPRFGGLVVGGRF